MFSKIIFHIHRIIFQSREKLYSKIIFHVYKNTFDELYLVQLYFNMQGIIFDTQPLRRKFGLLKNGKIKLIFLDSQKIF